MPGSPLAAAFGNHNSGARWPPDVPWRLVIDRTNALSAGLVAAWPDCLATSGDRLNGAHTLTEVATTVGGQGSEFGFASLFSGSPISRCDASLPADFDSTTASLSIWLRLDATPGATTGFYGRSDTATTPNGCGFLMNTTPAPRFVAAQNISNKINIVGNTVTVGRWTHYGAVVRPAGSTIELYQDGVQVGTATSPTGFGFPAGVSPSIGVNVGVAGDSGSNGITGACANAFWWNRALSPEEMGAVYAKPWSMYRPTGWAWAQALSTVFDGSFADALHLTDQFRIEPFVSDSLVLSEGTDFILEYQFGSGGDFIRFHDDIRVDSASLGSRRYRR